MGLLAEMLALREQRRRESVADIEAIGTSVRNFVDIKNTLSQIEAREKGSILEDLQTVNAGLQFANETRNAGLRDQIVTAGNRVLGQQSGVGQEFLSPQAGAPTAQPTAAPTQAAPVVDDGSQTTVDDILQQDQSVLNEVDPFTGKPTERAKLKKKQLDLQISGEAQEATVQLKKSREARRNLDVTDLKIDATLDSFIKFSQEQFDLLGVKPGPVSGVLSSIITDPLRLNEFYQGFRGSTIEYAAAVGRNAMPGTRASRMIDLFRQTAPNRFDTIESGVFNAAVSWRQAIATDFSQGNQDEYIPGYSNMSLKEQQKARNKILKPYMAEQEKFFRDNYLKRVYKVNPELLQDDTQVEVENLIREELKNMTPEELEALRNG